MGAQGTSDECDDDEGGVSAVFYVSGLLFDMVGRDVGDLSGAFFSDRGMELVLKDCLLMMLGL